MSNALENGGCQNNGKGSASGRRTKGTTGMKCQANGEVTENCCLDGRNLRIIKL